jgi:hypothetical protein
MAANWDPRRFHAPYAERFVESLAAYARRHLSGAFRHAPPIPPPPDGEPGGKAGEPATRSTKRRAAMRAQ